MKPLASVRRAFALAVAIGAATASSATALTLSPAGAYETLATDFQLRNSSNGQTLTCDEEAKHLNLSSDGSIRIATGGLSFVGCVNRTLGRFTVTQTSAWSGRFVLTASRLDLVITIPASGVQFTGTGCTFWLDGTITKSTSVSSLPTVVNSMTVSSSSVRIARNNGGLLCAAFPSGLVTVVSGTLLFDRSATASG